MAKNYELPVPNKYGSFGKLFTSADTTSLVTLYTSPVEDANLVNLIISNNDVANTLYLYIETGGSQYAIGHIAIAANAGTNGTVAAIDGLDSTTMPFLKTDNSGNLFLQLKGGDVLKGQLSTNVTAAKFISVYGITAEYVG